MSLLRLGVFYLQERLAVGGSAEVGRAVQPASSRVVAVKLLREPVDHDAVAREARAVATLLHPNVVRIVDQGQVPPSVAQERPEALQPDQPYLVMELGEATLWEEPPEPGFGPLRDVLRSLLDGLAHAHARGVVHRDLKPSNVLWIRRGRGGRTVAIADFGLARLTPQDGLEGAGTPGYMAPEQFGDGTEVGPWTDLYALGVMARELSTAEDGLPRFPLPDGFAGWISRLTEPRVPYRLLTAAEARYALDALAPAMPPPRDSRLPPIWSEAEATRDRATQPPEEQRRTDPPTHTTVNPVRPEGGMVPTGGSEPLPRPLRRPLPASWREPLELGPIHVVGAGLGLYPFRALPIIGRESERDELWRALLEVVESEETRSRAVLLTGSAGVGKTRLAEWLARRAVEVAGVHAPRVRMREDGRPGNALLFASREFHHCERAAAPDAVRAALRVSLPRTTGEVSVEELEALTRALILTGVSPMPTPKERRAVAVKFLCSASLLRPFVLVLDGLHWDEQTVLFLESLLAEPGRVLVVATIGLDEGVELPERLQALLRHEVVRELPVTPLPPAEHQRLVRELLGLSQELAARVEARTMGNPLFAVQLVGDWVSRGVLAIEKGALSLPHDQEEVLPDDLHALWLRRVQRLTKGRDLEQLALELAAVLGPELDMDLWRVSARSMNLTVPDSLVARLLRSHLMIATPDGRDIRFAHGMIRESLLRHADDAGRLPALHSAAADAIHPRFEAGRTLLAEDWTHHLRRAGRFEEALDGTVHAARGAIAGGRFQDALTVLDTQEALREALGRPPEDRLACESEVLCASAFNRMGRLDEAARAASRALALIADDRWTDLEALALHQLGYTDYHRGKSDLALSHLTRAAEVMETLALYEPLARCLRVRGELAHGRQDFAAARRDFTRALEVSEQIGDRAGAAASLLGLSLPGVGDPAEAERARLIFEELGHCSGASTAINTLAEAARRSGRLEEAERLYRRARRWARMGGVSQHEHICGVNLALTMLEGGRFEEAFVETELGARMTALLGQRLVQYMFEVAALAAAIGSERVPEAHEHLERALELQQRVDHADRDVAWSAQRAAELSLERGELTLARGALVLAREEQRRLGGSVESLDALGVQLAEAIGRDGVSLE